MEETLFFKIGWGMATIQNREGDGLFAQLQNE